MKRSLSALLIVALLLSVMPFAFAADTVEASSLNAVFHNGSPMDIIRTPEGGYLITDTYYKVIWQLNYGEEPVVLAGRIGVFGQDNVPLGGYNDSGYENAAFASPWGLTPFLNGYLVSDPENNAVRFLGDGQVFTAAGTGTAGKVNGRGVKASFNYPTGLATDDDGNAYIADTGNNLIRKMTPEGDVTIFAGNGEAAFKDGAARGASFNSPMGLCWFENALYVADTDNHVIRKIENGQVTTFAGTGYDSMSDEALTGDWLDGKAADARFSAPIGLSFDSQGALFVSDSGNAAIRKVENGIVSTYISSNTAAGDPFPVEPRGLLAEDEGLMVCDSFAGVVFSDTFRFEDVNPDAWFYSDVQFAVNKGLFKGESEWSFAPDLPMSRGMLVTALGRLAQVKTTDFKSTPFTDVKPDSYYAPYAAWAFENEIVTGRGLSASAPFFAPESPVSRAELVTILWRYACYTGADGSAGEAVLSGFTDSETVPDYAYGAVCWAVENGIMKGFTETLLSPDSEATRAQVAAMLHRYLKLK